MTRSESANRISRVECQKIWHYVIMFTVAVRIFGNHIIHSKGVKPWLPLRRQSCDVSSWRRDHKSRDPAHQRAPVRWPPSQLSTHPHKHTCTSPVNNICIKLISNLGVAARLPLYCILCLPADTDFTSLNTFKCSLSLNFFSAGTD